eukprot:10775806-Alexandrium_andersonii.AAC.1
MPGRYVGALPPSRSAAGGALTGTGEPLAPPSLTLGADPASLLSPGAGGPRGGARSAREAGGRPASVEPARTGG